MRVHQLVQLETLTGKTFSEVDADEDRLLFVGEETYSLHHEQDCCETVWLEDVCGDLGWLVGTPITLAERRESEVVSGGTCAQEWTFFEFVTSRGAVTVRFCGDLEGCYALGADLFLISETKK